VFSSVGLVAMASYGAGGGPPPSFGTYGSVNSSAQQPAVEVSSNVSSGNGELEPSWPAGYQSGASSYQAAPPLGSFQQSGLPPLVVSSSSNNQPPSQYAYQPQAAVVAAVAPPQVIRVDLPAARRPSSGLPPVYHHQRNIQYQPVLQEPSLRSAATSGSNAVSFQYDPNAMSAQQSLVLQQPYVV
jgi:hypothetical protein